MGMCRLLMLSCRFAAMPKQKAPRGQPEHVGSRLKRLRQELGLTQQQLADRIGGFEQAQVSQWENGRGIDQHDDFNEAMKRAAEVLGCDLAYLLTGVTLKPPPGEHYRGRMVAVAFARECGLDEDAIQAILKRDPGGRDPGPLWWWRELQRLTEGENGA